MCNIKRPATITKNCVWVYSVMMFWYAPTIALAYSIEGDVVEEFIPESLETWLRKKPARNRQPSIPLMATLSLLPWDIHQDSDVAVIDLNAL